LITNPVPAAALTRRAAAGIAVVAAILATTAPAQASTSTSTRTGALAAVPPPCGPLASAPPLPVPATTAPAGPALRALADRIASAPGDTQTGRYTRIGMTMTAADSSIGDCAITITAAATETRWRDETTDSGRVTGVPWHPASSSAPAMVTTWYRQGEFPGILPGRAPADPAQLAAEVQQRAADPAGQVHEIGDIAQYHDTPLGVRQAILRVLADIPGVHWRGPLTVAGHRTVVVSIAGETGTQVLAVDATTGEIIAAEQVLTDPVVGRNLGVTVPYSLSRTMIIDRGRSPYPGPRETAVAP
jgi:hypothetical protein